jgi:hypothetical protein
MVVVVGAYLRVFWIKRSAMVVVVGAYLRVFWIKRSVKVGVGAF